MLIETKYRDLPAAAVRKLHATLPEGDSAFWEGAMRGKAVLIQLPPIPPERVLNPCGMPWYQVVTFSPGDKCRSRIACSHLLDLGD